MFTQNELNEATKTMEAYYDRIVVLEDPYKSGRECTKCNGKGHLGVKCLHCKGTGSYKGRQDDGPCPDCTIGKGPLAKSLGHLPCDLCSGQGTSSIIVPEDAEKRPTTGIITSVGHMCRFVKTPEGLIPRPAEQCLAVGMRIIFTNFSGNKYELGSGKNKSMIRILKEAEVLGILHSAPEVTPEAQEFKELSSVGVSQS